MQLIRDIFKRFLNINVGTEGHNYKGRFSERPPHMDQLSEEERADWADYLEHKEEERKRPKILSHNYLFKRWKKENNR